MTVDEKKKKKYAHTAKQNEGLNLNIYSIFAERSLSLISKALNLENIE